MNVPFKGTKDICEDLPKMTEDPETKQKFMEKGVNTECPVQPVSSVYLPQLHVSVRLCE
jgi:hypothetical protein